jgi:hypothetical protein
MRRETYQFEAEECFRRAAEYQHRPEGRFLIGVAIAFQELASKSRIDAAATAPATAGAPVYFDATAA